MKRIIARIIAIIPALSIQVLWYCLLLGLLSKIAVPVMMILAVLSFLFTLFIINKRDEGSYKGNTAQALCGVALMYYSQIKKNI